MFCNQCPGMTLFHFPGIILRMHVLRRLHLLFLHACPKKAIVLSIIWARSSRLVHHPVCSCLLFSPYNLSTAFFGSTTVQLLRAYIILVSSSIFISKYSVCNRLPYERFHPFHPEVSSNSVILPNSTVPFLALTILALMYSEHLPVLQWWLQYTCMLVTLVVPWLSFKYHLIFVEHQTLTNQVCFQRLISWVLTWLSWRRAWSVEHVSSMVRSSRMSHCAYMIFYS